MSQQYKGLGLCCLTNQQIPLVLFSKSENSPLLVLNTLDKIISKLYLHSETFSLAQVDGKLRSGFCHQSPGQILHCENEFDLQIALQLAQRNSLSCFLTPLSQQLALPFSEFLRTLCFATLAKSPCGALILKPPGCDLISQLPPGCDQIPQTLSNAVQVLSLIHI